MLDTDKTSKQTLIKCIALNENITPFSSAKKKYRILYHIICYCVITKMPSREFKVLLIIIINSNDFIDKILLDSNNKFNNKISFTSHVHDEDSHKPLKASKIS